MNKTARLIITLECNRQCSYCINTPTVLSSALHIDNLEVIKDYPIVCITGGEPMLNPYRTIRIIRQLKKQNPAVKIYLYTAKHTKDIPHIMKLVDGINYTIHEGPTLDELCRFLLFEVDILGCQSGKSFHLRLPPGFDFRALRPELWGRINDSSWLVGKKCKVADGEVLYIDEGGR